MADITPVPEWGPVPVLDTSDLAEGGEGGRANAQAQALTNLIYWLLARGAGTTYDPDVTYLPGALTVKDERLQIFDGATWKNIGQDDAALKKASNLSDVPDKAEARENLDVYPTSVIDAMNTTIPLGVVWFWAGNRSAIPDSCAPYDGDVVNRADFPDLWADIAAGKYPTVSESVWLASGAHRFKFSTGNGSTTFRFPDYNGVKAGSFKSPVLRGDGYAPIGGVLGDAIRNITGTHRGGTRAPILDILTGNTGAFTGTNQRNSATNTTASGAYNGLDLLFDASLVVPTADENRPNSGFGVWIGKVRGGTRSTPAEGSPATLLANEYLGAQKINGPLVVTGSYTGDLLPNVKAAVNATGTAPISACRGFGKFNGRTGDIIDGVNISSISRISAGTYEVALINAMSDTNYIVVGVAEVIQGAEGIAFNIVTGSQTTTSFRIFLKDAGGSGDRDFIHFAIFGG